jgi:hypothetical protein
MHLFFLVGKLYKVVENLISILETFEAPKTSVYSKPQKYNEFEYWMETSKLQMEFYLKMT